MAERLVIYLTQTENVDWLIINDDNTILDGPHRSPLNTLSEQANTRSVLLLVPSIAMQIVQTQIPKTSHANLVKAIPYALEDTLADNIDSLHFALLNVEQDQQIVAVVSVKQMDQWKQQLDAANIVSEEWLPDLFALPKSATTWTVLFDEQQALCSCGHHLKFATDKENVHSILQLYLETDQYPKPNHIEFIASSSQQHQHDATSISGVPLQSVSLNEPVLNYLVSHLPASSSINLLQGDYRPTRQQAGAKQIWRYAAAAAALWLITVIGHNVYQYFSLHQQQKQLQQQVAQIYKTVFPTATAVVSPKFRFEQELKRLHFSSGGGLMLSLLAQTIPIIKKTPNISIKGLEYKNQQLNLNVRAQQFQQLDALYQALLNEGLNVEQRDAQRRENFVATHFIIRKPQ